MPREKRKRDKTERDTEKSDKLLFFFRGCILFVVFCAWGGGGLLADQTKNQLKIR